MATTIYKNIHAECGFSTANFAISGGSILTSYSINDAYDLDRNSYLVASGTSTNLYVNGQFSSAPAVGMTGLYIRYGAMAYCDLIDFETSDPEFGSWSLVTKTDVYSPNGLTIVTSGVLVNQPTESGDFLLTFSEVSTVRTRYRVALRKDPSAANVGVIQLAHIIPVTEVDLPSPAYSRQDSISSYGARQELTLGGKRQYTSFGVDPRHSFEISYEFLNETQKNAIIDVYESCRGGTYPFLLRIDNNVYPCLFVEQLTVQEEQAGLYNVTIQAEGL